MIGILNLLVDLVLRVWQSVPVPVIHNLDKARSIKKVFWHLNVDGIQGDYFEFGVAHGHSMRAAQIAEKHSHSSSLGIPRITRQLYGFDTFEKFIGHPTLDKHPTWQGDAFNVSFAVVSRRFSKAKNVHLFKLDVNTLVDNPIKTFDDFGITRTAAVILFDMDLYGPTRSALFWMSDLIQQGTFLIFDEFFAFGGDRRKGECRALQEFLDAHPDICAREFSNYGSGGKIFVIDRN